jgi:hypothetical protein
MYNHSDKFTLPAAIGGRNDGRRWYQFEKKPGTTVVDFIDFTTLGMSLVRYELK